MVVLVIPFLVRLLKKAKWHIIVLLRERPLGDNVGPNTFLEDQKPTAVKTISENTNPNSHIILLRFVNMFGLHRRPSINYTQTRRFLT